MPFRRGRDIAVRKVGLTRPGQGPGLRGVHREGVPVHRAGPVVHGTRAPAAGAQQQREGAGEDDTLTVLSKHRLVLLLLQMTH